MTENRTCLNCAVSYLIEPPRVPTAEQLKADPQIANRKPVRVCRLNPPVVLFRPDGSQALSQAPTDDYFTCWHWRAAGTLPGDPFPLDPNLRAMSRN
jgi:hypothetical protein